MKTFFVLPSQQKPLSEDVEPKANKSDIRKIKKYFEDKIPFTTEKERMEMLSNLFKEPVESFRDISPPQAEKFINNMEIEASGQRQDVIFKDRLLSSIGYKRLFGPSLEVVKVPSKIAVESQAKDIYDTIRLGGGIDIKPGDDFYTEWKEGVSIGKKRQLGSSKETSKSLDEWSQKLDMSNNELMEMIKDATLVGEREEEAKELEERMVEHYEREEREETNEIPEEFEIYLWEVRGEPGKQKPANKVQEIYGDMIEDKAGYSRKELMKMAWKIWRNWVNNYQKG